jgi:pimeloyl-ACP methyl ester carboxylesterase
VTAAGTRSRGWAPAVPDVTERCVQVEAADGVLLPGTLITPARDQAGTRDQAGIRDQSDVCVVWLPGFGLGPDYGPYLDIGRQLAAGGVAFAAAAVRGYHGAVTAWRRDGARLRIARAGSWYEVFADTVLDVTAWLDAARAAGYRRVVLAGHSFGAIKALYYLARGHGPVDGLVLASPSLGLRTLKPDIQELARDLVERGAGQQLLPSGSWPGFGTDTVSAQTYHSWAEVAELIYDPEAGWPAGVRCPVLAFYGLGKDVGAGPELAFFTGRMSAAHVSTVLIEDLGHNYADGEEAVAATIRAWLHRRTQSTQERD